MIALLGLPITHQKEPPPPPRNKHTLYLFLSVITMSIFIEVVVSVSDGEAIRVLVGPPMLSSSDPSTMSAEERLDFITW